MIDLLPQSLLVDNDLKYGFARYFDSNRVAPA